MFWYYFLMADVLLTVRFSNLSHIRSGCLRVIDLPLIILVVDFITFVGEFWLPTTYVLHLRWQIVLGKIPNHFWHQNSLLISAGIPLGNFFEKRSPFSRRLAFSGGIPNPVLSSRFFEKKSEEFSKKSKEFCKKKIFLIRKNLEKNFEGYKKIRKIF